MLNRRKAIGMGGGFFAALALPAFPASAEAVAEIVMGGRVGGSHVWFDPVGLLVQPGQMVRWINRDPGNAHTATAYHPANSGKPNRIPPGAQPWDSGYLLPDESFSVKLTVPGVYDYFCITHEQAGMVGRIIVGAPPTDGWQSASAADDGLPQAALQAFPAVEEIMAKGRVEPR